MCSRVANQNVALAPSAVPITTTRPSRVSPVYLAHQILEVRVRQVRLERGVSAHEEECPIVLAHRFVQPMQCLGPVVQPAPYHSQPERRDILSSGCSHFEAVGVRPVLVVDCNERSCTDIAPSRPRNWPSAAGYLPRLLALMLGAIDLSQRDLCERKVRRVAQHLVELVFRKTVLAGIPEHLSEPRSNDRGERDRTSWPWRID